MGEKSVGKTYLVEKLLEKPSKYLCKTDVFPTYNYEGCHLVDTSGDLDQYENEINKEIENVFLVLSRKCWVL